MVVGVCGVRGGKGDESVWDDDVEVSVFDGLVGVVKLCVKRVEIVPSKRDAAGKPAPDLLVLQGVGRRTVRGVAEGEERGVDRGKGGHHLCCRPLERSNRIAPHQVHPVRPHLLVGRRVVHNRNPRRSSRKLGVHNSSKLEDVRRMERPKVLQKRLVHKNLVCRKVRHTVRLPRPSSETSKVQSVCAQALVSGRRRWRWRKAQKKRSVKVLCNFSYFLRRREWRQWRE